MTHPNVLERHQHYLLCRILNLHTNTSADLLRNLLNVESMAERSYRAKLNHILRSVTNSRGLQFTKSYAASAVAQELIGSTISLPRTALYKICKRTDFSQALRTVISSTIRKKLFETRKRESLRQGWYNIKLKPIPDPNDFYTSSPKAILPIVRGSRILQIYAARKYPGAPTECILCRETLHYFTKHITTCIALPENLRDKLSLALQLQYREWSSIPAPTQALIEEALRNIPALFTRNLWPESSAQVLDP